MRVRFLEPRPPGHHVYDLAVLPRLGLPLMATMLAERGHDVRCHCDVVAPVDVEDCLAADLVGISCTTSTAPYAYLLADEFEAAGVPVVMGGAHVSFLADEALAHARYVVRGEGERTICELVDVLERDLPLEGVAGLSWRDDDRHHHNEARPRCDQAAFEALPIPDLTLIDGHQRLTTKPLMTQWGCPFDCEFCSVTAMFSRSVRHRRNDQVLAELADLGADRVFFHDDNFVVDKRRTRALLEQMVRRDLDMPWFAQVRAADTVFGSKRSREPDHGFLSLMRRAGCRTVMVGFESISDDSLVQANKQQTVRDVTDAVELFHRHGIRVHGMFVVGFDTDAPDQAERTTAFAKRVGIDTIQIMIETPLPGTRLYERAAADGRLLTVDWQLYDGHHVVMQPLGTHPRDLQEGTIAAMETFYSRSRVWGPAVRAAWRGLPELTRMAVRNRGPRRLPALAHLAARRRWHEIGQQLRTELPGSDWKRLEEMFTVPALRAYGRRQVGRWGQQDHSRRHLELLAGLPTSPITP